MPGKIRWLRTAAGWTQDDWAAAAKINPGSIGRWEDGRGMLGSPVIQEALKCLSQRLDTTGLANLVVSELRAVQAVDFRRPPKTPL